MAKTRKDNKGKFLRKDGYIADAMDLNAVFDRYISTKTVLL